MQNILWSLRGPETCNWPLICTYILVGRGLSLQYVSLNGISISFMHTTALSLQNGNSIATSGGKSRNPHWNQEYRLAVLLMTAHPITLLRVCIMLYGTLQNYATHSTKLLWLPLKEAGKVITHYAIAWYVGWVTCRIIQDSFIELSLAIHVQVCVFEHDTLNSSFTYSSTTSHTALHYRESVSIVAKCCKQVLGLWKCMPVAQHQL